MATEHPVHYAGRNRQAHDIAPALVIVGRPRACVIISSPSAQVSGTSTLRFLSTRASFIPGSAKQFRPSLAFGPLGFDYSIPGVTVGLEPTIIRQNRQDLPFSAADGFGNAGRLDPFHRSFVYLALLA